MSATNAIAISRCTCICIFAISNQIDVIVSEPVIYDSVGLAWFRCRLTEFNECLTPVLTGSFCMNM